MSETPATHFELQSDPLLRAAPTIEGFKVLDPAVLYQKIGQGGMGAVYRGRHFKLDLDVAVKCLKPSLADEAPEFVARFEREARLAASLAHQNVVRVMDVHQKHGLHYLVMEFVRGESARERVLRKGRLGEQEALAILLGATTGLAEAHQRGIVHRDIKPDNVLVSTEGRVKLADLGLAKASAVEGQSLSLASGVMGTPQYMAPEQWDSPDVGPAADVWALGATLFYLLTGEHAIEAATLAAVARRVQERDFPSLRDACPGLADEVLALFERCVQREPARRFADARALLAALKPLVRIEEAALADAAAASNTARQGLVSPPPRQTLLRIRAVVESGMIDAASGHEAPTIPSPGGTMPMVSPSKPRRRRWPWLLGAAAVLGGVGLYGYVDRWWDGTDRDATMRQGRARSLYSEADALLPQPGRLDEAIAKLEEVLSLWPDYEAAKRLLALALDKRAEQLAENDLDGAFVAARRANELQADNRQIAGRYEALMAALRARLTAGLEIASPTGNDVLQSAMLVTTAGSFELRGRITSPGVAELRMLWPEQLAVSRAPAGVWRKVPVLAGDFVASLALPVGDSTVQFSLQDERGVEAVVARTVRVAGRSSDGVELHQPGFLIGATARSTIYNAAGCRMLPIPVQQFHMGSLDLSLGRDADETQHVVNLERPFWLADTEVTRTQWCRIMATSPWSDEFGDIDGAVGDLPATHVGQRDAIEFCDRLTELERTAGRLPEGYLYVLPTEAQWEYACRGGGNGTFGNGIDRASLARHAVYQEVREGARPSLVGQREPNACGLYDMHGNVAEWCVDLALLGMDRVQVITPTYLDGVVEPLSPVGSWCVHRGGSFASPPEDLRAAARAAAALDTVSAEIGFRPALAQR